MQFFGVACHRTTPYLWYKKQYIFAWNLNVQYLTLHLWNIVLSASEWCYYFLQMHKPINFCQMLKLESCFYYYYFSLVKEWTSLIWFCLRIWQVILTINLNLSSYQSSYKFLYFEGRLSKHWKIIFLNRILVVCERNVFIVTEWYGNSNCSTEVYDSRRLEFTGTSSPTRCKSRKHSMFLTV